MSAGRRAVGAAAWSLVALGTSLARALNGDTSGVWREVGAGVRLDVSQHAGAYYTIRTDGDFLVVRIDCARRRLTGSERPAVRRATQAIVGIACLTDASGASPDVGE